MSRLGKKIWKVTAASLATLVILLALGVAVFRIVEPLVPEYRQQAEQWAETILGLPVEIDRLDLRWAIFGPEIVLRGVRLLNPTDNSAIVAADEINVGISLVAAAMGKPQEPRYITLVGPNITVTRGSDGRLSLAGWMLPEADPNFDWRVPMRSMSKLGSVQIEDANIHWVDESNALPAVSAIDLNLQFESSGETHQLAGSFSLSNELEGDIVFDLSANGDPGRPESWQWDSTLEIENLPVDFFQQHFLPREDGSLNGELTTDLQIHGEGFSIISAAGSARFSKLQFVASGPGLSAVEKRPARIRNFDGEFELALQGDTWELGIEQLRIARGRRDPNATIFTLLANGQGDSVQKLDVDIENLSLVDVQLFARWFIPPESEYEELKSLSLVGALSNTKLGVDLSDEEAKKWSMDGLFSGVGFRSWRGVPGLRNLGGKVIANHEKGEVLVDTADFHIDFAGLFRGPLTAETLSAGINWKVNPDHWQLLLDDFEMKNTDASVKGQGRINIPIGGGAPQVDVKAWLIDGDGQNKSAYLPVGIMQQPLIDWLDNSIVQATVPNASLVLRGDLAKFPFAEGDGLFEVRFRAEDGVLDYANGWPRIDNLDADVVFRNIGMFIEADGGVIESSVIQQAQAKIEDLTQAELYVTGTVDGQVNNGLDFLRNSPLRERFGTYLEHAHSSGDMSVVLDIKLPIDDLSAVTLNGVATLGSAELDIRELPRTINNINGELSFTETALNTDNLSAEFVGVPVEVSVHPDQSTPRTRVKVVGSSNVGRVFEPFRVPLVEKIKGQSNWIADIMIPNRANEGQFQVLFESELQGTSLDLPPPLYKAAEADNHLGVTVDFEGSDDVNIYMEYQPNLASRFRLRREADIWGVTGGHFVFGSESEPSVDIEGISITGSVDEFAADAWNAIDDEKETQQDGYIPDPINRVDVEIGNYTGFGQQLTDHRFQLSRGEKEWLIRVQGDRVAGTVLLPAADEEQHPIVLDMQRMYLAKPVADESIDPDDSNPGDWPAMLLSADDFSFDTMKLGAVNATVEKTPAGLKLANFEATSEFFTMTADGRWEIVGTDNFSAVDFQMESTDVGETLSQLGYSGLVNAKRGKVNAGFTWNGPPFHKVLERADGKLTLEIEKGQIVDVRPGAGKLLGILSIASLPRRLIGDFSDVSGKGLGFDSIRGDFLVFGGSAYTTNMMLKGSVAEVALIGRTGIVARDYDNVAIVNTDVASTLPVIGALAAGTGVGAIILVLSQLIKKPLKGLTRTQYHITGSWDEPVFEKMTPEQEQKNEAPK